MTVDEKMKALRKALVGYGFVYRVRSGHLVRFPVEHFPIKTRVRVEKQTVIIEYQEKDDKYRCSWKVVEKVGIKTITVTSAGVVEGINSL